MAITVPVEDFQIGRVVSRTFGVLGRNIVTFLAVATLVMLPVLAINLYLGSNNYLIVGRAQGWVMGAVSAIFQMIFPYLLQAGLVQATITDLNGERPSLGGAISTGFGQALPVAIIAIISLLGLGLGLILLVVPGLFLITGWSVVVPVRVAEHTSIFGSFSRSWDLTQTYRWKILGLLVIYGIIVFATGFVVLRLAGLTFLSAGTTLHNAPFILMKWVETVVYSVVGAVGVTAIYYELRTVKEGVAPDALIKAFD